MPMTCVQPTTAFTAGRARVACTLVLAVLWLAPAQAAEVTRLGVASAMGDVLTVVVHRPELGS